MKRFFACLLLLSVLLVSACTSIEAPDTMVDTQSSEGDYTPDNESEPSSISDSAISSADVALTSEDSFDASSSLDSVESSVDSVSSVPDSSEAAVSNPNSVFVSNGILISGTMGMEQYFGSTEAGTKCSQMISAFKNDLGDAVQVYTVIAPHASCYYAPEGYSYLTERGRVNFDNLKAQSASNVNYIDVYNALLPHVDEPIYHRTEFHWAALAGYYAAEAFATVANVNFADLSTYKKIVKPGFVGSAYTFSKADVIKNNPEDFVIYMPQFAYKAYYYNQGNYDFEKPNFEKDSVVFDTKSYAGAFLCGDSYTIKVVTGNTTGRKLVIFKDSYGNAFAPFTIGSFDEVYIVDIRYYSKNGVKLCQEVGATDVVFALSGFTATGVVYKNIEKLRTAA